MKFNIRLNTIQVCNVILIQSVCDGTGLMHMEANQLKEKIQTHSMSDWNECTSSRRMFPLLRKHSCTDDI